MGFNLNKVSGTDGSVRMPDPGVLVGWFSAWSMTKQDDGTYWFKGTFGHVNALLWNQAYPKVITVKLSREKVYGLCRTTGPEPKFDPDNKTLTIEGVTLCAADEATPL